MPNYDNYAQIGKHDDIQVRGSVCDPWPQCGWNVKHARLYAEYILELVEKAERENPEVLELIADIEAAEEDSPNDSLEEIAIRLVRKGYRK